MFSFWDGTFSVGPRVVLWDQVVEIRHARERHPDERTPEGFVARTYGELAEQMDATKYFDTEPLGQFQTQWEDAHLPRFTCSRCGEERKIKYYLYRDERGAVCTSCHQRERYELENKINTPADGCELCDRRPLGRHLVDPALGSTPSR